MSRMPAWGDAQISRFKFRESLFQRRGLGTMAAEALADKLANRDYERDDRRLCIECESLNQAGKCFLAIQGKLPDTPARHEPVIDLLQRCAGFTFQKP